MDADPPNIRGRPKRSGDVTDPPIPIHRGNGDSMSGGYLGQRGRPVPDAVAPYVRFDERGWETGLHATAPVLDSTVLLVKGNESNRD